jgi:hypothetical protein
MSASAPSMKMLPAHLFLPPTYLAEVTKGVQVHVDVIPELAALIRYQQLRISQFLANNPSAIPQVMEALDAFIVRPREERDAESAPGDSIDSPKSHRER